MCYFRFQPHFYLFQFTKPYIDGRSEVKYKSSNCININIERCGKITLVSAMHSLNVTEQLNGGYANTSTLAPVTMS